jgi:hypothetical protein
VNKELLLAHADFLENNVSDLCFDMSTFGRKYACQTVACSAGWAGLNPAFQARGLQTKWFASRGREDANVNYYVGGKLYSTAFEAMQLFFDLPSYQDAIWLFTNHKNYHTIKEVVAGLRRYVETGMLPGTDLPGGKR